MRNFTFKGLFLTAVFMLLGCLSIQAANEDLITKQITIKLDEAGTLPNKIASSEMYKITNLKITGEINGTDWKMIREMAGSNYKGEPTEGMLSVLDLSEAKIVKGGDYYYNDNNGNEYNNTSNDVIGSYAFYGCSGLTSLTLPDGITSIGLYAFYGCSGLTSLNLPEGITKIGRSAFSGCSGLTSLNLPEGITKIGMSAFSGCSGLTSLTLPEGITSINISAFSGCSGLKEVRFCINDNLDTYLTKGHPFINVDCDIKYYINDKEITSIEIPSNVTTLGQYVFQKCRELTGLTLPSSITNIGISAFSGCSGLTSLTLPSSITKIGMSAFSGCSGLTSLTLPDGITSIGENAFINCSGLTSIYAYAEKVPKIGSDAFKKCDAKKCTVYVPKGTYDDYRFSDFGYFENIVEFDATGIDKTTTSTDVEEVSRYSVNGQRLVGPTKGLNIVKYSDGSMKKVAVE